MDIEVWRRSVLVAKLGAHRLRTLVAQGRLIQVGNGWYARPTANEGVLTALRLGGRLGCLSGCALHGLWVPPHQDLHVVFNRTLPPTLPARIAGHIERDLGRRLAVRPLMECLEQVVRHHDTETALIVLDSALNRRLLAESDVVQIVKQCPKFTHRVLHYLDGRAEAGTETRVRYFFQRRRVPVEPQVHISGVGRVDLRVGRSLLIECDSRAHHTGEENYARDRRRDLVAVGDDNKVLRLSYAQVFYQWPETQGVLNRIVAARLHRRPPLSAR